MVVCGGCGKGGSLEPGGCYSSWFDSHAIARVSFFEALGNSMGLILEARGSPFFFIFWVCSLW